MVDPKSRQPRITRIARIERKNAEGACDGVGRRAFARFSLLSYPCYPCNPWLSALLRSLPDLGACLDRLTDDRQDLLALAAGQRQARGADHLRAVAALRRRQLDVLHQLDVRVEVQQRREPP